MLNDVLANLSSTFLAPSVPYLKNQGGTPQATPLLVVPPVPLVPPEKVATQTQSENKFLSAADHQKFLAYLAAIGETDQDIINGLLTDCVKDAETLACVLNWADKVVAKLLPQSSLITGRLCQHFKSFNKHGGGAGHCSAGAWSYSNCCWADTAHQCDRYQI